MCESAGLDDALIDSEPKARRSVTHSTGESDLELEIALADGTVCLVLIENKVDAAFQPLQADRYRGRGRGYVAGGKCATYRTLLVAPARYLGDSSTKGFDAVLSYQAIDAWFRDHSIDPARARYKRALISAAIDKSITGYQAVADRQVTDFWERYRSVADQIAPELNMPPSSGRPASSTTIFFKPDGKLRGVELTHKFTRGHVDLEFGGWGERLAELRALLQGQMPSNAEVVRAAKSAALRWRVEPLGVASIDDDESMIGAIRTAASVLRWDRENVALIESITRGDT